VRVHKDRMLRTRHCDQPLVGGWRHLENYSGLTLGSESKYTQNRAYLGTDFRAKTKRRADGSTSTLARCGDGSGAPPHGSGRVARQEQVGSGIMDTPRMDLAQSG
jgi:hypothetical protein